MTALPPVEAATLPADVRAAGPDVQRRYQAGLGFERQLTAELAKQLTETAGDSLKGPYAQLLPDAMADALTASGGLGLARQLAGLSEHEAPE